MKLEFTYFQVLFSELFLLWVYLAIYSEEELKDTKFPFWTQNPPIQTTKPKRNEKVARLTWKSRELGNKIDYDKWI